jgi:hypothetical protein
MSVLDAAAGARADARFEAMVDASFAVLLPNADDFGLAKRYLGKFNTGLRAGDALHLAIAGNRQAARSIVSTRPSDGGETAGFADEHGNMSQAIGVDPCMVRATARASRP